MAIVQLVGQRSGLFFEESPHVIEVTETWTDDSEKHRGSKVPRGSEKEGSMRAQRRQQ
jgi:hypothetical protein